MIEQDIEIRTSDGTFDGMVTEYDTTGLHPVERGEIPRSSSVTDRKEI